MGNISLFIFNPGILKCFEKDGFKWLKIHRKIQTNQETILHQKPMTLAAFQNTIQGKLRDKEIRVKLPKATW